jgi:tetratricopeptide (TPR) repeat protein
MTRQRSVNSGGPKSILFLKSKFWIIIASVSFLLCCGIVDGYASTNGRFFHSPVPDTSSTNKFLRLGIKKMALKKYDSAMLDLKKAIEYDSENWRAFQLKGECEMELKNFKNSVVDYTEALRIHKTDTVSLIGRADAHRFNEDFSNAIKDYNVVLQWNPKDLTAHFGRAISCYHVKTYGQAIADFDFVVKYSGKPSALLYLYRGHSYLQSRQYKKAIRDFTAYFKLGGDDEGVYFSRGYAYSELYDQASTYADSVIADLKVYERTGKRKEFTSQALGGAYLEKKDTAFARKYFLEALAIDPLNDNVYYMWGTGMVNVHDYSKAEFLMTKAISLAKQPEKRMYYLLGKAKAGVKDTAGALDNYRKALDMDSSALAVYAARIRLLYGNQKYDKSNIHDLTRLINLSEDPQKVSLYYASRSLIEARGHGDNKREADVNLAIKMKTKEPLYYIIRGVLRNNDHQDKKLILADYNKALSLKRDFTEGYLMRAFFNHQNGDVKKACSDFSKAEKLGAKTTVDLKSHFCENKSKMDDFRSALDLVLYPYLRAAIF